MTPEVIGSHTRFLNSGVKLDMFFEKDCPGSFSQERAEQEEQDIVLKVIDSLLGPQQRRTSQNTFTRGSSQVLPDDRVPVIYPTFLLHLPIPYLNSDNTYLLKMDIRRKGHGPANG